MQPGPGFRRMLVPVCVKFARRHTSAVEARMLARRTGGWLEDSEAAGSQGHTRNTGRLSAGALVHACLLLGRGADTSSLCPSPLFFRPLSGRSQWPSGAASSTCPTSLRTTWAGSPWAHLLGPSSASQLVVIVSCSKTARYGTNNRSSSYECLLYESLSLSPPGFCSPSQTMMAGSTCLQPRTCPLANLSHEGDAFVAAKCGEQCGEDEQRCMMVRLQRKLKKNRVFCSQVCACAFFFFSFRVSAPGKAGIRSP